MSVVNSCLPCYRGDVCHKLSAHIKYNDLKLFPDVFNFTLSPDPALFPGTHVGNRAALIKSNIDVSGDWPFGFSTRKQIMKLLSASTSWSIDTRACYDFIAFLENNASLLPESKVEIDLDCLPTAMELVKDCGLINPKDFVAAARRVVDSEGGIHTGDRIIHFMTRLKSIIHMKSVQDNNRQIEQGFVKTVDSKGKDVNDLSVKDYNKITINYLPINKECPELNAKFSFLFGVFFVYLPNSHGVLLTSKDLDRICFHVNAKYSTLKLGNYMSTTYNDDTVNDALNYFCSLTSRDMDKVPEAFVSASNISLNGLAGFLSMNGMTEMIADHIAEGLEEIIPHEEFLTKVNGLTDIQHRAFRSIIRIALPPTYDVPGIFSKEKLLHSMKNPVGIECGDTKENRDASEKIYVDFLSYNRLSFIRQFHSQNARYPGNVENPITDEEKRYNECVESGKKMVLSLALADRVNLRGCLAYQTRSANLAAHFKDTAMTPHSFEPSTKPISETNQLAYMATAEEKADLEEYRNNLGKSDYIHYHKVGFKNESAKESGRLFFISELMDKMLLGEVEDNVGAFLKSVPGNAVGAAPHDVSNTIFKSMCVEPASDEAKLLISDDISKWSPYMPIRVQLDSTRFWSEVFDQPWMINVDHINMSDYVILDTQGWRAHYPSNGSNKEGQTGKRMSYLMTNLKSFAIARCRGKYGGEKLFAGAAHLLTFLDDGFTAVDLKVDDYENTAKKVLDVLVKIQGCCGFKMKLKKSFPSDRFCQFLAREYYMGARIYDFMKSISKRCIFETDIVTSLTEDIREVTAWASGATESGTPKEYVYSCYIIDCIKSIARKTGIKLSNDPKELIWLFAPTAAGGCGVMPPHGVLASLVRDLYVEQMEIVRAAAIMNPSIRSNYVRILNAECTQKSGRGVLRAHKTVTLALDKMSEQRVTRALEERFIENGCSIYLRDLTSMCSGEEINEFGIQVALNNPKSLGVNLDDLYESSPLAMYDSILAKFKKSSTLVNALGSSVTRLIIKAYQEDARRCHTAWCNA